MNKNDKGEFIGIRTQQQQANDQAFKATALKLLEESGENWALHNLAVMKRNALARILYLDEIYRKIIPVPGVICEFGVQWGASLATLTNLRGLYEPYNHSRIIYGFDTFSGFRAVSAEDGGAVQTGDYKSQAGHEHTLNDILTYHESICPFPERRKFELIKGDASETVKTWLSDNPHAVIALAIFDMDLYQPTRDVLEAIRPRLVKGSLLVFDEFNCKVFPGETAAVAEVLGLKNIRPTRHPLQTYCMMLEVE